MKKMFWFLAVIAISVVSVFAQLTSSSLVGTVASPDGLIPGATVVVRDNQTGNEVTTVTNEEGGFRVPNLDVGTYTVTITASGFKTFTAEQVKIDVSKDYTLAARLEVGGIQETVVVTAGAEIINSVDAEINNTVSRKQLDDLPSLGRNPLNFVTLQPGVSNNPNQQPVVNGIRTSATNITIDGINVQDNYIRSNATGFSPARPTVDEVEEFAVSTQTNADDGFGGAQIQFSTRRGGNDFHFRLFEFNRNSELAANDFFNNAAGHNPDGTPVSPRPFRNRNQFGGNVSGPLPFLNFGEGGPVSISGRDKLFFFFAYEKLIDRVPADPQFSTVLTPSARQGIFTYRDNSGQLRQVNLFNPAFGTGITGINPLIANRFLANIPQGNTNQVGDQLNTTGFQVIQNN
ncbi:MAG: carboxypeptidase regulatory-like domain-containing protein, partial [Acidobacteria bacterium]|nr:carboxypeptidase regulatory-like domain-containing protein [Acidobacteriota bacterium]